MKSCHRASLANELVAFDLQAVATAFVGDKHEARTDAGERGNYSDFKIRFIGGLGMKKLSIATALVAMTASAFAAEMPVKAPVVKAPIYKAPVTQVYDWPGFYIGVNAGGSVGRSRTHTNGSFPADANNPVPILLENETTFLSAIGAIAGGQI